MFDFLKKNDALLAPISGRVMDLKDVPDEVFAQKMAGDGAAIDSTGDVIVAPADGVLSLVFRTNHAFGMITGDGVEVLVHIGLDTVELKGCGFLRIAREGDNIRAGDPVIRIDRKLILSKGYSLITPVLITNTECIKNISYRKDARVEAGRDAVIEYKRK